MTARRVDVAIVGAGIAGLTAATDLVAAGRSVSVHEARDRVGGRLHSSSLGALAVDLGATWFWPDETRVQAMARDLGLETFAQDLTGDALFEPDARGPQRLRGNPLDVRSGRFVGGAQALALGLAERLPVAVLHLADPVSAVTVTEGRAVVDAASGSVMADQVVLAVPPALAVESIAFTPVLPDAVRALAESTAVWMGSVVKAVALYEQPFWRHAGLAGAAISHVGPFRELHDHSGPGGSPAALFGFAGSDQLAGATTEQVAEAFTAQLVRLLGPAAAHPQHVLVVDWSREPRTTPADPSPRASTGTYGHPQLQGPVHGRIHWASTETSAEFAGHVEGAIRAGARAAARITRLVAPRPA